MDSQKDEISRKEFTKRIAGGLGGIALSSSLPGGYVGKRNRENKKAPNIVFISCEQYCFKYTGYAGHRFVQTPNLDRIARRGITFNNAYTTSPVCVPGRAGMMTGMFPSDSNSFGNSTVWDGSNPTWVSRLQEAGYQTWGTGKLDLNHKFNLGFEQFEKVGTPNGHSHNPDITSLFRRPLCYRMSERPTVDGRSRNHRHKHDKKVCHNALEHLRTKGKTDKPWAAYLGFTQVHSAFVALEKYYQQYYPDKVDMPNIPPGHLEEQHLMFQRLRSFKRLATPIADKRIRRARAGYFGMIGELDEYVGRVWEQLKKTGQLENTIFVFTADHGEMLGAHGLWYKNNLYEQAAHVPLLMAGGGLPEGKRVDTPVSHMDLVYTLLEHAGARRPDSLRGHSLTPLINDNGLGNHPGYAYAESHSEGNCTGSFMIRKGDWKYLHFTWYDDLLFNLSEDPGEFANRISDPSTKDIQHELKEILRSLVDPEEVTRRGFRTQQQALNDMVAQLNPDKLFNKFKGRLGIGQAKALVNTLI